MNREEQLAVLAEEKQETILKYSLLVMLSEDSTTKNKTVEYITICPRPDINVIKDKGRVERDQHEKTNKSNSIKLLKEMPVPKSQQISPKQESEHQGMPTKSRCLQGDSAQQKGRSFCQVLLFSKAQGFSKQD